MDAQIFEAAFKDFRGVLEQAAAPVRNYNRTSEKPIYKPEASRFKLVVWFKDGNTRYFFSFDHTKYKDGTFIDEFEGLKKLIRLVDKFKGTYKNAIIYANLDEKKEIQGNYNCEILKYNMYGTHKTNEHGNFKNEGKNVIFDAERMKYLQKFKI